MSTVVSNLKEEVCFDNLNVELTTLKKKLGEILGTLLNVFEHDVLVSQMLEYFDWLQEGKSEFYALYRSLIEVEPSLLRVVDLIEQELNEGMEESNVARIFDLIEDCTYASADFKLQALSVKNLFDTAIEFNEIFKDHMNALDTEIEHNLQRCFEIQQRKFSSPVRHTPSFTLDQLVTILSSSSGKDELKAPNLSTLDKELYDSYVELKSSIDPIERSLKDILLLRIKDFECRDVVNINYLCGLLEKKYMEILEKYEFLANELDDLKIELVDKRWNALFTNLNTELSCMLHDTDRLALKLETLGLSNRTKQKIIEQLGTKSKTIDKTFNIIYKALEASLLSNGMATTTNDLAGRWLDLKNKLDSKSLLNAKAEENLSSKMEKLSVGDPDRHAGEAIKREKHISGGVGAMLFKRMNIKPVLVDQTPKSAKQENPFYDNTQPCINTKATRLSFTDIPCLPFNRHNITEIRDTSSSKTKEELEHEKIVYYTTVRSKIPVIRNKSMLQKKSTSSPPRVIPRTPTEHQRIPASPHLTGSYKLKPPTPVSTLLSPICLS